MLHSHDGCLSRRPGLAAPKILVCALVLGLSSACTSFAPALQAPEEEPGVLVKYPVHEGDTVRVTLAYPDTGPSVPPAASQDSLAADESFGPDAPGESGQEGAGSEAESGADAAPPQGESVDARLAEGTAGRCCKEFEVQQVGEDGLYGKNIFVPWDQIQSIQLAQPDHLKTAALVVTFPLWFPLAVVSVALVAGPIALGAAEIALTPSAR